MNATNRGLNRVILFVVGVLLIASGGAVTTAMLWPMAGDLWKTGISSAVAWMQDAHEASLISEATTLSWFVLALLFVLLLVVVAAVLVIAQLGGGRSNVAVRFERGEGAQGAVTIRQAFASDAITHSLRGHGEILSSRVSTRRLRGEDVLHVSVTPRQNVSPVNVASTVTDLLDNLAVVMGRETPTLVSIRSGIRSRLAADQSRVN